MSDGSAPISTDATFCLASASKLITSVAAMQCVERGLIGLDDNVTRFLPEWEDGAVILKGFDKENNGKPILELAKQFITLRSNATTSY